MIGKLARLAVIGTAAAALALAFAPGAAQAARPSGAQEDGMAAATPSVAPPLSATVITPNSSASTYLFTPAGRYAHVWKTWTAQAGGGYYGSWGTYSHSSGVTLWEWEHGAWHNYGFYGSYSHSASFYLELCDSSGCSGNW